MNIFRESETAAELLTAVKWSDDDHEHAHQLPHTHAHTHNYPAGKETVHKLNGWSTRPSLGPP